jgi:hypothetical protein
MAQELLRFRLSASATAWNTPVGPFDSQRGIKRARVFHGTVTVAAIRLWLRP